MDSPELPQLRLPRQCQVMPQHLWTLLLGLVKTRRLPPQQDGAEPPGHGGDTKHLEAILCICSSFNKPHHYTSPSPVWVPEMLSPYSMEEPCFHRQQFCLVSFLLDCLFVGTVPAALQTSGLLSQSAHFSDKSILVINLSSIYLPIFLFIIIYFLLVLFLWLNPD